MVDGGRGCRRDGERVRVFSRTVTSGARNSLGSPLPCERCRPLSDKKIARL
jgi:hypothetical protein